MKVVIATPTITRPHDAYLASLEASVPLLDGIDHSAVFEIGNPYISAARASMLRKAMDAKANAVVFIDHDVSWRPQDLLTLIQTEGDVIAGTYRFKRDAEEYMGGWHTDDAGQPVRRGDGCFKASRVPAGFLKVTAKAVDRFMEVYPELVYGPRFNPYIDLFNHGAIDNSWYGEDYAFSKRWTEKCGDIWIVPDLGIGHHGDKAYPGNLHKFMQWQPADDRIMLTHRQAEVVDGVRRGKQNKHIAHDLNMAEATVKAHLRTVMKKMKATNRTEVAVSTLLRG